MAKKKKIKKTTEVVVGLSPREKKRKRLATLKKDIEKNNKKIEPTK